VKTQLSVTKSIYRYSDMIYKDHPQEMVKVSDRRLASNAFTKLQSLFFEQKPKDNHDYVQIYGRYNNERIYKWFRKDYLANAENFDKYKVILPKANGSGAIGEVLSTPLIGEPLIVKPLIGHTETFISIGAFDNELEAKNVLKYIKTKVCRTMLGILKTTQDNPAEKWAKVPMQDFTANSEIDWSKSISEIDQQLYKKYGFDDKEIAFIEEKVRAME